MHVARTDEAAGGAGLVPPAALASHAAGGSVIDEMPHVLGEDGEFHAQDEAVDLSGTPPHVIMLVGLQGSGKTTTAGKLALNLRKMGKRALLVAADTYRPAAVTQLEVVGKQLDIPVHSEGTKVSPPEIVRHGIQRAREGAWIRLTPKPLPAPGQ